MRRPEQRELPPVWTQIYAGSRWDTVTGFMDAALHTVMAFFGLSAVAVQILIQMGVLGDIQPTMTQSPVIDRLIYAGLGGLLTWWGLRGVYSLLKDAVQPGLQHEGPVDRMDVRQRMGVKNFYREWTLVSGAQSWSLPYLAVRKFTLILKLGDTVRIQYRQGTRAITGIWVLRAPMVPRRRR